MKTTAAEALNHWAAWARQTGYKPSTCCSMERLYLSDPERYIHPCDKDQISIFKPTHKIAEKVEDTIRGLVERGLLSPKEIYYLVVCDVYGYKMTLKAIAKRLSINEGSLETYRLAARNKIKGAWNG